MGTGPAPRHRRIAVLRGRPEETAAAAAKLIAALAPEDVLWVGAHAPDGRIGEPARRLVRRLGASFDALVLDLHAGLNPDALGCAHGLIWGGGTLLLRLPPLAEGPPPAAVALAVFPYGVGAVGQRSWARLERGLAALPAAALAEGRPLAPLRRQASGTPDQEAAVAALLALFAGPPGACLALIADRGRGKSAALGLALAQARGRTVAVLGEDPSGTAELRRFAGDPGPRTWTLCSPGDLLRPGVPSPDVVLVDEAARLSVALLQRLVNAHPHSRFAFASTTHGYEGTGRGFQLRFLRDLADSGRPLQQLRLLQPIRWDPEDPLEAFVFDLLALDAEPAILARPAPGAAAGQVVGRLQPSALAQDEGLLRQVFGLLISAHYRTTPSDLERLLDAPNLELWAILEQGQVVAACILAQEGGLPAAWSAALADGQQRIRGHALADNLVVQSGRVEAGPLRMKRSVRIATHPDRRREGLARRLVEAIHQDADVQVFGTVFGATVDLLRFRRSLGYRLVRLGSSRGDRSGAPAVVMLRPVSAEAHSLCDRLQRELALNLIFQRELLLAEGPVETGLLDALAVGLPVVGAPTEPEVAAGLAAYLRGPRRSDGLLWALRAAVSACPRPPSWTPTQAALVQGRLFDLRPWPELAERLGLGGVPATQRALRKALSCLQAS